VLFLRSPPSRACGEGKMIGGMIVVVVMVLVVVVVVIEVVGLF